MPERTFVMNLTPQGAKSNVQIDGHDISGLLRGVVVRSDVHGVTTVELQPGRACHAQIVAKVPEAQVVITMEPQGTLWATIIDWFEREHGYNPDPSKVPDGDVLRWALAIRQDKRVRTLEA